MRVAGAEPHDPTALRIKGCSQQPCQIEKGSIASVEVDFEVGWDVSQLDVQVTAYALATVIPFPLKQKNACMSLTNAECPLDKYEEISYSLQLDIDAKYPSVSRLISVTTEFKLAQQGTIYTHLKCICNMFMEKYNFSPLMMRCKVVF